MALANYSDLETALTSWADDRSDVAGVIPECVRLAESHLNLVLRCREMVTSSDLTTSSGTVTLPTDFLGVVSAIEKSTPRRNIQYFSRESLEATFDTTTSGLSCGYTIYGETMQVAPQPSNDIELTYYQEIPSLETNSTNWLMTKYPAIYLEASQVEVYRYLKMDEDAQITSMRLGDMLSAIMNSEDWGTLGNASPTLTNITPVF